MQWFQSYEANFGKKLTQDEVDGWQEEIKTRIQNVQPGETIDAVRDMAERSRKGEGPSGKFAPTCNHIISAIIRRRGEERSRREGTASPLKQDAAEIRSRIKHAISLDTVWNIISAAYQRNIDEGLELEKFARETHGAKFARPIAPNYERVAAIAESQGITIQAAHKIAWDEANAPLESAFDGSPMVQPAATDKIAQPMPRPDLARAKDEDTPVSCALDGLAAKTARAFKARMGAQPVQSQPVYRAPDPEPEDAVTEFVDF